MTPPDNERPDDEDGGTFKLKPGAAGAAPEPAPAGEEPGLDRTMKIQRQSGAPAGASPPPPPPSPLGNPTGPAEPNVASFAETTVMPQQGGSQTGFQPAHQPPPPNPLGSGPIPQPQAQQQYPGQQPGAYPPPPGYAQPQQAAGPQGPVPEGVKRIGLMAMIAGGTGLVSIIVTAAMGGFVFTSVLSILFALAVGAYGFLLPRGQLTSSGLRQTGIWILIVQGAFGLIGVLGLLAVSAIVGVGVVVLSLLFTLVIVGADAYAAFIFFKDLEAKAYMKGPQAPGGYPPAGYPQQQQQYGQQQQPPPGYGQPGPQQPQPGAYPPPPGYPQQGQQPPQPPYGG